MVLIWFEWCMFDKLGSFASHVWHVYFWVSKSDCSSWSTWMSLGLSPRLLSFPAHHSVWIWFHFSHFLFSMTATLVIFLEIFLVKIAEKNLVGTKGLFVIVKWVRREREWARRIGTSIALVYYLRQTAALYLKKKTQEKIVSNNQGIAFQWREHQWE